MSNRQHFHPIKRRKAIRQLAVLSSGIVLLPGCNLPAREEAIPQFANLPLMPEEWGLMKALTRAILPVEDLPATTPETTAEFVLRMVNDCSEPENILEYRVGMKVFSQFVQDKYVQTFDLLNPEQHLLTFAEVMQSEILPDSLRHFLETTKRWTVRHFTTSEYFMKNHLGYEFVPGRFHGCVPVAG